MPFDNPYIDTLPLPGAGIRRMDAMLFASDGTAGGALGGVRPGDAGLVTSVVGTAMTVTAGVAAVPYTGQGVYRAASAAAWSGTVAAFPNSPQTRKDLVYLRVWDSAVDASGLYKADVQYLQGTPSSGTPALPTPSGTQIYIPLAQINVPSSGGGSATVTDLRPIVVSPGGIAPGGTATGLYVGQYRDNPSTGALERWNGSAWMPYAQELFVAKGSTGPGSTNTTYTADPALTLPLAAGATYRIDAQILYATLSAAGLNLRISYSGSSSASSWTPGALIGETSGTNGNLRADVASIGTGFGLNGGAGSTIAARPYGFITTTSAGNLFVEWCQNTANVTATTVVANSWLSARRVG